MQLVKLDLVNISSRYLSVWSVKKENGMYRICGGDFPVSNLFENHQEAIVNLLRVQVTELSSIVREQSDRIYQLERHLSHE